MPQKIRTPPGLRTGAGRRWCSVEISENGSRIPPFRVLVEFQDCADTIGLTAPQMALLRRLERSSGALLSGDPAEVVAAREMVAKGVPLEIGNLEPDGRRLLSVCSDAVVRVLP